MHIRLGDNMKPIRNSIKAIIIRDRHVLLIKNIDKDGFWYVFPGGGQDSGEDTHKQESLHTSDQLSDFESSPF
jgi:8-oxo-dGTP pyrophosphatase MutT (NUDIX family)